MNDQAKFDSIYELHMHHYSRPYRPRFNIVPQRRADIRLILALREWQEKDAEVEGETIVVRRSGVN